MATRLFHGLILSLAMGANVLLVSPATAAPTVVFYGSRTSVALSSELVTALTSLKVTPSAVFPGFLRQGVATFPISTGEIDVANAKGEVLHYGGLRLASTNTQVELTQFAIDTSVASGAILTGLVKVGGSVVGRIPLFLLTLPSVQLPLPLTRTLVLPDVALTLTDTAAQALNASFGVTAFAAGIPVGKATMIATGVHVPRRQH
jgi:hypothetical protein